MRAPADTPDSDGSPKLKLVRRAPGTLEWKSFVREQWRALTVLGTLALGIVIVLLGWYGAAHTNIVSEQIPYLISGGLLGLGLIIVAGFMAYSFMNAEQNDEFRRQIVDALGSTALGAGAHGGGARATTSGAPAPTGGIVYIVPGGKGYHLPGCPIVEGKSGVRELRLIQAIDGGYVSCKLCSAD